VLDGNIQLLTPQPLYSHGTSPGAHWLNEYQELICSLWSRGRPCQEWNPSRPARSPSLYRRDYLVHRLRRGMALSGRFVWKCILSYGLSPIITSGAEEVAAVCGMFVIQKNVLHLYSRLSIPSESISSWSPLTAEPKKRSLYLCPARAALLMKTGSVELHVNQAIKHDRATAHASGCCHICRSRCCNARSSLIVLSTRKSSRSHTNSKSSHFWNVP
jgi:hypothetical protein